jgi:hypothetical protein
LSDFRYVLFQGHRIKHGAKPQLFPKQESVEGFYLAGGVYAEQEGRVSGLVINGTCKGDQTQIFFRVLASVRYIYDT